MTIADRRARWLLAAAVGVFFLYAANFLYFFVDDEGISFVYAQHLLRGQGLIYNTIEGRVEGYSNFLDVMMNTAILAASRAAGWPKLSVFFTGKAVSLLAGIGTLVLSDASMRRLRNVEAPGLAAGLLMLATAGPLALWSCSSLETVPFAFLVSLLVFALVSGGEGESSRRDALALAAAVAASLERLDGPIYVAAVCGAWFLTAGRARRGELFRRVGVPLVLIVAAYHGWRVLYFGDWLNMPAYTKVLYKLGSAANVIVKAPEQGYLRQFVGVYGWPAVAIAAAGAVAAAMKSPPVRPVLLALAVMIVYVGRVGDWMFGLRFMVPLLPLMAILVAQTVTVLCRGRERIAWAATLAVVCWCGYRAVVFERRYEAVEGRVSWLRQPSLEADRYFSPYDKVWRAAALHIPRGSRLAYNQAGFVPFMLDAENVDDLGICSRFYAQLPTLGVFFTEVGRYAPLTTAPVVEATEAYLLYQDVPLLIQRADLLRSGNGGRVPATLIGGYYELIESVGDTDAIYRRSGRDAAVYKQDPSAFTENLAHVARLRSASLGGKSVAYRDIPPRFPFLRQRSGRLTAAGRGLFEVRFADADVGVSELFVNAVSADAPVTLTFELASSDGTVRFTTAREVGPGAPGQMSVAVPPGTRAAALRVTQSGTNPLSVELDDLRVLGQSRELAAYIRSRLTFPPD